jgi:putative sterol carrier protein
LVLRYLSESWAEQALQQVESDERVLAATRGLQLSLLAIILNAPKDAYGFLYVAFDYAVFAAIQRGEITERRAILTGKLHLTGSLVKALRHMRALETVTASLRTIACET